MPRNRSVDARKTSLNLSYYYRKAKKEGRIEEILEVGGFGETAIRTAISRGRISIAMIDAFSKVMGVDPALLIGEEGIGDRLESAPTVAQESDFLTDEQMLEIIKVAVTGRSKAEVFEKIKRILDI